MKVYYLSLSTTKFQKQVDKIIMNPQTKRGKSTLTCTGTLESWYTPTPLKIPPPRTYFNTPVIRLRSRREG